MLLLIEHQVFIGLCSVLGVAAPFLGGAAAYLLVRGIDEWYKYWNDRDKGQT